MLATAAVALGLVPATILVFFVFLASVGISTELPAEQWLYRTLGLFNDYRVNYLPVARVVPA
jgi:hypothetical protein